MVLPYSGITFASTEVQGTSNFTISNLVNENVSDLQNLSKEDQNKSLVDLNPSVERGSTSFKMDEIQVAATDLKSYVDKNHKLPSTVKISSKDVSMPQFLQILVTAVLQIKNNQSTSVGITNINAPTNPTGDLMNGEMNMTEYMDVAQRTDSYIKSNGAAPNFTTCSSGNIQYESLIYIYAKTLDFYKSNNRLPNTLDIDSWKISFPPSDPNKYLQETRNSQSSDSEISELASSLTQGITSAYDKAVKIFNWVRDNITYTFYYNTKYGANGTLDNKTGNCVDHSHLLVALARSAGIPSRYLHADCTFNGGSLYGHVWVQLLINNRWYDADTISTENVLGVINNWDEETATMKGSYIELPF